MLLLYSCLQKDNLVGAPQVKLVFPVPFDNQDFRLMPGKFPHEVLRHIFTDLLTVLADGRPNRTDYILRLRAKFPVHGVKRLLPHSACGSAPAGM